ncbi:hypothetical protein HUT19_08690 [Streptomyces sp. NA02950]|uniref:hypothetical protein n=1 Tax=Streptomyces sp. NA02950 TaxID=2742137 RepID=UPI0015929075|nr:hypothetical protein [Streptomyces sp. NA02950]QKV91808.1 hypothetical protein HUT19_08690 [Streptomyces sp. NA02950]
MEIAVYITLFALVLLYPAIDGRMRRLDRRAARIERKVDLVIDHLGITVPQPGVEEVVRLLRENKKVEAIKVYRKLTDADLVEAKEAVDRMERLENPGR